MIILTPEPWADYELLDTGNGRRLERFGVYVLSRPDPQILWQPSLSQADWSKADAVFEKTANGEKWVVKTSVPESWQLHYDTLMFLAKLTPFKHTGVFPEQAVHWQWMRERIEKANRKLNILNLFAYTGVASLIAAEAGAAVTHVDASKPAIAWARENQHACHLDNASIRWIVDDALKFTKREHARGVSYDGILLDPPVYGHGPHGETWDFSKHFPMLLAQCKMILSEAPVFFLINAYAVSASALMLENVLSDCLHGFGGAIETGELALKETSRGRLLSTGIFGRWSTE